MRFGQTGMIEWVRRWLFRSVPQAPHAGDRFITVRSNGSAHFDLAAYLLTPEGCERLNHLAARIQADAQFAASRDEDSSR